VEKRRKHRRSVCFSPSRLGSKDGGRWCWRFRFHHHNASREEVERSDIVDTHHQGRTTAQSRVVCLGNHREEGRPEHGFCIRGGRGWIRWLSRWVALGKEKEERELTVHHNKKKRDTDKDRLVRQPHAITAKGSVLKGERGFGALPAAF